MALDLDPLDSTADRSLAAQLADQLRDLITGGTLQPGDLMPSQSVIKAACDVSDNTIRNAMQQLRSEGLIDSARGKGVFVRQPQVVRHVSSTRYAGQRAGTNAESAFTHDLGIQWDQYSMDCEFGETPATPVVAALLRVDEGDQVFRRVIVMQAGGRAEQLRTTYFPLDLVRDTPMTDPANQPVPGGVIAELAAIGVTVTAIDEEVQSRMPTPHEAHTLRIPDGVPVLAITRVGWADGRPVEAVSEMVLPADRIRLHYRLDLEN